MQEKDSFRITVTGDLCLKGRIEDLCLQEKYGTIFGSFVETLQDTELLITNLECPLTESQDRIEKVGPHLRAAPECVKALEYIGVDIVTLANNHILDYGADGLMDTIDVCKKAGIGVTGAGANIEEAASPIYLNVKGVTVAIINACESEFSIATERSPGANPLHPVKNYYQIVQAKRRAECVLVIVHGGHEHYRLPSPRMVETYRFFIDIGASAVIGHHPHCSSGYEIYNGKPILYSLGNFIFDRTTQQEKQWYNGYFVRMRFACDGGFIGIEVFPYYQCANEPGLAMPTDEERDEIFQEISALSTVIQNKQLLEQEWKQYTETRRQAVIASICGYGLFRRILQKFGLWPEHVSNKGRILRLSNLIECEAHRDVLIEALQRIRNVY